MDPFIAESGKTLSAHSILFYFNPVIFFNDLSIFALWQFILSLHTITEDMRYEENFLDI